MITLSTPSVPVNLKRLVKQSPSSSSRSKPCMRSLLHFCFFHSVNSILTFALVSIGRGTANAECTAPRPMPFSSQQSPSSLPPERRDCFMFLFPGVCRGPKRQGGWIFILCFVLGSSVSSFAPVRMVEAFHPPCRIEQRIPHNADVRQLLISYCG